MTIETRTALLDLWDRCPECKPECLGESRLGSGFSFWVSAQGMSHWCPCETSSAELLAEASIIRWLLKKTHRIEVCADEYTVAVYLSPDNHTLHACNTHLGGLIAAATAVLDSK